MWKKDTPSSSVLHRLFLHTSCHLSLEECMFCLLRHLYETYHAPSPFVGTGFAVVIKASTGQVYPNRMGAIMIGINSRWSDGWCTARKGGRESGRPACWAGRYPITHGGRAVGSDVVQLCHGATDYCLWLPDDRPPTAAAIPSPYCLL